MEQTILSALICEKLGSLRLCGNQPEAAFQLARWVADCLHPLLFPMWQA